MEGRPAHCSSPWSHSRSLRARQADTHDCLEVMGALIEMQARLHIIWHASHVQPRPAPVGCRAADKASQRQRVRAVLPMRWLSAAPGALRSRWAAREGLRGAARGRPYRRRTC